MKKRPLTVVKSFFLILVLVVSVGTFKFVITELSIVSTELSNNGGVASRH
jgi:hypothetical protein